MTSGISIKRLTILAACAVMLLMSSAAMAKIAVVYLKDRATPLKGELVQDTGDKIVLKIANIPTTINKADIVKMDWELSLSEQFQQKRAAIKDTDYEARYELARWAYSQEGTEGDYLARTELQSIVKAKPDFQEANLLLKLVNQQIEAAEHPDQGEAQPNQPTQPQPQQPANDNTGEPAPKVPLLDREQVNLIKVLELDLSTKPAITIPDKTINEFLDKYRANKAVEEYTGRNGERRFKSLKGYEQVKVLFNAEAREFYKDVIVRDEPQPLTTFRQIYYPTLVQRQCGSCHANGEHKGLYVITRNANREDVAYTNFLILNRTSVNGQPLINRKTPANSLLLQYGLPRDEATYPHPKVNNFKPYFQGPRDKAFLQAADWIGSLYPYNDNYPVDYKAPTAGKKKD